MFVSVFQSVFYSVLPWPEPTICCGLTLKSNQKMYLKVPVKPNQMPEAPDPENKKLIPDENTWVYKEYQRLQSKVYECIEPLEQYIETFKVYKDEYKLDPDEVIAQLADEEQ